MTTNVCVGMQQDQLPVGVEITLVTREAGRVADTTANEAIKELTFVFMKVPC